MPSRAPRPAPATRHVESVAGMTCRTCERRIERYVGRIPGVERVSASSARGRVEYTASAPIPRAALEAAVNAAGYQLGESAWISTDRRIWLTAGLGLVVVAVLAVGARAVGIFEPQAGAAGIREGGLVVALLLGLTAGVSTCLALTGGLVLALSASFAARRDATAPSTFFARIRPSAVFVWGRIVGFATFGALLGAVGATVAMPPWLVALLMLAVAVVMTLLGVRLTGLSPRLAGWTPTLPPSLAARLGIEAGAGGPYSDGRAAILGAATFFLPCGFTQAVQVYALSTGSPLTASAIMTVFAVGTAPGLLALGGLPNLVPGTARPTLMRVVGVVVLAFAVVNGLGGLRLVGVSPEALVGSTPTGPVAATENGVQVVRTVQRADGYTPAAATIHAGQPTRWVITSEEGGSCAIFLRVPALDISVMLTPGENEIDLPPMDAGTLAYTCSMGMYGGSFTIVPPPTGARPVTGG
ncbi:MAG TPA: sulfite exporter TauE/SafE family protein [Candidatus Limnocylindrales bacterium]|nr:sulfite exporter TauE/SafE family protein [Candidatus Limnocylindrales bacterium]